MRKISTQFTRAAVLICAATLLFSVVGCSKDDGPKLRVDNAFVKTFVGGHKASCVLFGTNMVRFIIDHDSPNQRYNKLYNEEVYWSLLQKYNDVGLDRNLTLEEMDYLPHMDPIMSLECRLNNSTSSSASEINGKSTDVSNTDKIRIRFKTYAPYIMAGYQWPSNVSGPLREMTLKEFNATCPHSLIDVRDIRLFLDDVEQYWQTGYNHIIYVNFTLEDGSHITGNLPCLGENRSN